MSIYVLRGSGHLWHCHFYLVYLSVDSCFRCERAHRTFGAAFLPMHLYLAHYVTNEYGVRRAGNSGPYLCLRLLSSDTRTRCDLPGSDWRLVRQC